MQNNRRMIIIEQDQPHLSNNFFDKVGAAFTDPESRFEFPIKPMEFDMTKETKNAIYIGAAILSVGAIVTAIIISNKSK